jgi:tetratricopeptide (TPR) repeat protein
MAELKRGTILADRYALVRELGRGRHTRVWLATDRMTRAPVALKILVDPAGGPEALRREWQLSIRLVHPSIVRVFEFHGDGSPVFFSMQFIDGPDIGVLSAAPPADALAPVAMIARGLDYIHGRGLVHRDIKVSNILLDANGAPYLTDFGVAGRVGELPDGGSLIAASPQQLEGQASQPPDDVFALGSLVYELLAGRPPWSADSIAADILAAEPPRLEPAESRSLPDGIPELVGAMLDSDPDRRPAAAEVAETIRAAGIAPGPAPSRYIGPRRSGRADDGEPGIAPVQKKPERPGPEAGSESRSAGLSPRTVAISLALLVALLAGVVFLLPESVERRTSAGDTATDARQTAETVGATEQPEAAGTGQDAAPERDERVQARARTEEVLGRLLAKVQTLEARAVERWGGVPWQQARAAYDAGDEAYLARDYAAATAFYEEAIGYVDPLLQEVDQVFSTTLAEAGAALDAGDSTDAVRLYELAVAISPGHAPAKAGLERARNLEQVLALTDRGAELERNLEFEAARDAFSRAVELDPEWQPAAEGLARVAATIEQRAFDARMSEGLAALAGGDYLAARAAFRMAQQLKPGSAEPSDGLLQVEQGIRLEQIAALEDKARRLEDNEEWRAASDTYEEILALDDTLTFAHEGLSRSRSMVALHERLDGYIEDPDSLSAERTMRGATQLVVEITRMGDIGPRLADSREELARLLKRAATPLTVQLVSDQKTEVSIYKVGKLGTFDATELELRPGTYVAVGSRPGYRDVRLEFRVAPEIEMEPVIVRCEEQI